MHKLKKNCEVNYFKNRIYTLTLLHGGAFSKFLQSLLDGSREVLMLPAYPLLYLPQHWKEWLKRNPNLNSKIVIELIIKHHPSIVNTKKMSGYNALNTLGKNKNESISISKERFKKKLSYYLKQNKISFINTVISIHLAYASCKKIKINKKQILLVHTHDVNSHIIFQKFFGNFKTIYCVRNNINNLHRRLKIKERQDKDIFDYSDRESTKNYHYFNLMQMWLTDFWYTDKKFFSNKKNYFVKYEEFYLNSNEVIKKLCKFMKITFNKNIMTKPTFDGKIWWNDKVYGRKLMSKINLPNMEDDKRDRDKNIFFYEIFILEVIFRNFRKKFKYKDNYFDKSLINKALSLLLVLLPTKYGLSVFLTRLNPLHMYFYVKNLFKEIFIDQKPKNYYFSAVYKHKKAHKNMLLIQHNIFRSFFFMICKNKKNNNSFFISFLKYPYFTLYFFIKIILYPYFIIEQFFLYFLRCFLLIKNLIFLPSY